MKEQLKELRYIADVLDGTAHTRKATHELKAVERQSKGKLGKKTREDQAQKAIAAIVMSP